jgi:monoamine oxidase
MDADVIVVGAGLAGLTAARDVQAKGASAIVVEARDRVGGRLLNEDIGDGQVVEVGGQWIGPGQDRVAALARELGLETFPTWTEGEQIVEVGGKQTRYSGKIPKLAPHVLADLGQTQVKLERLARKVPLEAPWLAPNARALDSQTFWSWMRRNVYTRSGRALLEMVVEAVWAAEPADLSLLHVLFYINSAGGLDPLVDTEGGAQQDRFVGGSQLLAVRLADRLGEDAVRLGHPVRRIEHTADGVTVHADGAGFTGRRAIVAIPPTLAGRIVYDPPLPGMRDQLTQRMPQGTVIKTMAIYDRPFWRDEGLNGQATSDVGPAKVVTDNSPPSGSPGVLLAFLEGDHARRLGTLPADARRREIVAGLARLFGPRAADPVRFIERRWAEEEWTRGCYGCYFPPGGWTSYGQALRAPIGSLHWAGAETGTRWMGYMDGAVQSGERAAREVTAALAGTPAEAAFQTSR